MGGNSRLTILWQCEGCARYGLREQIPPRRARPGRSTRGSRMPLVALSADRRPHHVQKSRLGAAPMTVAMTQRDKASPCAVKRKSDQRASRQLVRNDNLRERRCSPSGLDDASDGLVRGQLHNDVELSRIDSSMAQKVPRRPGAFRILSPAAPIAPPPGRAGRRYRGRQARESCRPPSEVDRRPADLDQDRFVNVALNKAEIGVAVEHCTRDLQRVANLQLDRHARVCDVKLIEIWRQPVAGGVAKVSSFLSQYGI
jgi:hypothetical protein